MYTVVSVMEHSDTDTGSDSQVRHVISELSVMSHFFLYFLYRGLFDIKVEMKHGII